MSRRLSALMAVCCLAGLAAAGGSLRLDFSPSPLLRILERQPRRNLIVPRCVKAPRIDGRLDDAAWRHALELPRLGSEGPATRVMICFDDKALYIAVRCAEAPGREPVARKGPRDWRPWSDDTVDVWFRTDWKRERDYRFIINPAGSIYDAVMRGVARYAEYNPEWRHAVHRTPKMWTVEMAIPGLALGHAVWPSRIGFNIGRTMPGLADVAWREPVSDTTHGFLVLGRSTAERAKRADAKPQLPSRPTRPVRITMERDELRPGERWLLANVHLNAGDTPLQATRVRARVYALGKAAHLDETWATPIRRDGKLNVDLRRLKLDRARLCVELFKGRERLGVAEALVSARSADKPFGPDSRVAVNVDAPPEVAPVGPRALHFGMPFTRGAVWDVANLRVVDGKGREVPSQTEVCATWAPEGSVKWARFDVIADPEAKLFVEGKPGGAAPKPALTLTEGKDQVIVDTGAARYVLGKGFSPVREIRRGGRGVAAAAGGRGLYVIDQKGRLGKASAKGGTMTVEARGPVAASVRFEGEYRTDSGETLARHITRVELTAGSEAAEITHTLVLCRDSNEVWFREVGWDFGVAPGSAPQASFGVSHAKWQETLSRPLGRGERAYMIQDSHESLGSGNDHFIVAVEGATKKTLLESKECGDWAALTGAAGGLMVSCRDVALQHPKEFLVSADRINLRLFSPRGGEELDFRAPTLVKRWNLADWYKRVRKSPKKIPGMVKKVSGYSSNAVGWAKTHRLLLRPVKPKTPTRELARASRLHTRDVFALPDCAYVCATGTFGDIHPRDPKRFPACEGLIEQTARRKIDFTRKWDVGFVDYYAGPHYQGSNPRRYVVTYTMRADWWLDYARSGWRTLREFMARSEQSYMDNYYSHWDGPGKARGIQLLPCSEMWHGIGKGCLPFYWEGRSYFTFGGTTNLKNFMRMYYLTGDRRARDQVLEFTDGAKRFWTPARARHSWRQLKAMWVLMLAYSFNWDPEMRALADATTDTFEDRESALALTKNRPYRSSTYKLGGDVTALIDAWEITGADRYRDLALKSCNWLWKNLTGYRPIHHSNTFARVGSVLYRETGDPSYPQNLAIQLGRVRADYWDPKQGKVIGGFGASSGTFIYEGLPYVEKMLLQSGADRGVAASWAGAEAIGDPVTLVFRKAEDDTLRLHLRRFGARLPAGAAGGSSLRPVDLRRSMGQNLNRLVQTSNSLTEVVIPKDSEGCAYELDPGRFDQFLALGHSRVPLVVHAPRYWTPWPPQAPQPRWFFRLPKKSPDAQIFFEGSARLFDPKGEPIDGGKPLTGWIDLPPDKPGVWSFEPVVNQIVRLRNAPPFFAAGDGKLHFVPEVEWERAKGRAKLTRPKAPAELYVPGAVDTPGNKALQVSYKRYFSLDGGPDHPSGDGGRFLPHHSGTIEFFMKPNWGTFTMGPKSRLHLLSIKAKGPGWSLTYSKNPKPHPTYPTHSLFGLFWRDIPGSKVRVMAYHRTVIEPEEWVHIAWVWGNRETATHRGRRKWMFSQLFVNGKGARSAWARTDQPPDYRPLVLSMGITAPMAIDELRLSDVARYTADFTPPSRKSELAPDTHTRALFHFNGDLKGQSAGKEQPVGKLVKR